MEYIIYYFFIIFAFLQITLHKIINVEFTQQYGADIIEMKMNDAIEIKKITLNLLGTFNIIKNDIYSIDKSPTSFNHKYDRLSFDGNEYVKYYLCSDIIKMNNQTFHTNLTFFYFDGYINGRNSIALAYRMFDKQYSIIHKLYNQKIINNNQFGLRFISRTSGIFSIGGFDDNINQNKKFVTCHINNNYIAWGCNVSKAIFGENEYKSYYSFFDTTRDGIIAPEVVYNAIMEKIISKFIENKKCEFNQIKKTGESVICDCNVVDTFPDLIFIIEESSYKIRKRDLFDFGLSCQFIISAGFELNNIWVFGNSFIRQFPLLFDYQSKTVTVYKSDNINVICNTKILLLFKINLIILNIGITLEVFNIFINLNKK